VTIQGSRLPQVRATIPYVVHAIHALGPIEPLIVHIVEDRKGELVSFPSIMSFDAAVALDRVLLEKVEHTLRDLGLISHPLEARQMFTNELVGAL
jgi:hypothetical protein